MNVTHPPARAPRRQRGLSSGGGDDGGDDGGVLPGRSVLGQSRRAGPGGRLWNYIYIYTYIYVYAYICVYIYISIYIYIWASPIYRIGIPTQTIYLQSNYSAKPKTNCKNQVICLLYKCYLTMLRLSCNFTRIFFRKQHYGIRICVASNKLTCNEISVNGS